MDDMDHALEALRGQDLSKVIRGALREAKGRCPRCNEALHQGKRLVRCTRRGCGWLATR